MGRVEVCMSTRLHVRYREPGASVRVRTELGVPGAHGRQGVQLRSLVQVPVCPGGRRTCRPRGGHRPTAAGPGRAPVGRVLRRRPVRGRLRRRVHRPDVEATTTGNETCRRQSPQHHRRAQGTINTAHDERQWVRSTSAKSKV